MTTVMAKSILAPDDHLCLQPNVLDQRWPWREDDPGLVLDGRHRQGSSGSPDNPVGSQPHTGRGLQETLLDQRLQKRETYYLHLLVKSHIADYY